MADQQLIASKDVQRHIVINPDKTITLLSGTDEHSTIDESGGTQSTRTQVSMATLDGSVLQNGAVAHQCPNCGVGPWSTHAMLTCAMCRRLVCANCAQQTPTSTLCAACAKAIRRAAFWQWVRDIA